jgi:hypothetical protein
MEMTANTFMRGYGCGGWISSSQKMQVLEGTKNHLGEEMRSTSTGCSVALILCRESELKPWRKTNG